MAFDRSPEAAEWYRLYDLSLRRQPTKGLRVQMRTDRDEQMYRALDEVARKASVRTAPPAID